MKGFWREAAESPERVAIVDIDGMPVTAGALLERVNRISNALVTEQLSNQKHPRSYELRNQLPRSEAGKLLRRVLRQHGDAETTEQTGTK